MKTRFTAQTGIEFRKKGYSLGWTHVDANDKKNPRDVGPNYKTKVELLADHENYLVRGGWLNEDPKPAAIDDSPTLAEVRRLIDCYQSHGAIARMLHVDRRTVRRWASGETDIPFACWALLCFEAGLGKLWRYE